MFPETSNLRQRNHLIGLEVCYKVCIGLLKSSSVDMARECIFLKAAVSSLIEKSNTFPLNLMFYVEAATA